MIGVSLPLIDPQQSILFVAVSSQVWVVPAATCWGSSLLNDTVGAAHAEMKAAAWGRIVNIGSVALNRPFPGSAAYVAAKGAMLGVTRGLAMELGKDGITVNLIAPGWIPVERHADAAPEALERLVRETPLGHAGTPTDVAGAVLFFASPAASFVTGTDILVDGGCLATPLPGFG